MDFLSEKEQPRKPEIVKLNQDFKLLAPERTVSSHGNVFGIEDFKSSIVLDMIDEMFPSLPFNINFKASRATRKTAITLFDPEMGYRITQEDLDINTRRKKVNDQKQHLSEHIDFSKAPLFINVENANNKQFEELDLSSALGFKPEALSVLKRLRLQLKIPVLDSGNKRTLYLVSNLDETSLNIGSLNFQKFYPADTGPLPKDGYLFPEGFTVYVPPDFEKLKHIEGRFVLLPEKRKKHDIPEPFRKAFEDEQSID